MSERQSEMPPAKGSGRTCRAFPDDPMCEGCVKRVHGCHRKPSKRPADCICAYCRSSGGNVEEAQREMPSEQTTRKSTQRLRSKTATAGGSDLSITPWHSSPLEIQIETYPTNAARTEAYKIRKSDQCRYKRRKDQERDIKKKLQR